MEKLSVSLYGNSRHLLIEKINSPVGLKLTLQAILSEL